MHKIIGIIQKLDKIKLCAITTLILLFTAAASLAQIPHAWVISLLCSAWLVWLFIVIIIQSQDKSSDEDKKKEK